MNERITIRGNSFRVAPQRGAFPNIVPAKRRWPTAKNLWPVYAAERLAERFGRRDLANRIYAYGVTRGRR